MKKQFANATYAVVITLLATQMNTVYAFEGDSDKPARIESDSMELDFKTGGRILIGNVSIFQGSFELFADKVIAEYRGDVMQRVTAFGNPALVNDQPDADTKVKGSASRIEMDRTTNDIILTGNAKLFQDTTDGGGNPMKLNTNGERIVYNLDKETLKVTGGNTSTKSVGNQAPPPPKPKPAAAKAPAKPAATTQAPVANPASSGAAAEAAPVQEQSVEEVPRSSGRTRLVILPKGGVNKKMQQCGKGDEDSPNYIKCGDDDDAK